MLYFQMPLYFFVGAMFYMFPKIAIWLVVGYLSLFLLRTRGLA